MKLDIILRFERNFKGSNPFDSTIKICASTGGTTSPFGDNGSTRLW